MNIFYLDTDVTLCAQYHCDKHVSKMILETAQLLSTAHRLSGTENNKLYKATHKNHPSAVWVRENKNQYQWAYELMKELNREYSLRYGRQHLSWTKLNTILSASPDIPDGEFTPPPQCMPDEYKDSDTVTAYRKYYLGSKSGFAKWQYTPTPEWYKA